MADAGTLHDAFLDELRDTYDAEKQLTKALPKLAKAATSAELRSAFEAHLEETRGHVDRLERVFESLDEKARGKHCDGIAGIIEEGKSIMEEDFDEATMDACLIAAGQRAEHYEMAAYGTLVAWARGMGHAQAAMLLQETLDEEKAADEKLSSARRERHQPGCRGRGASRRRRRGRRGPRPAAAAVRRSPCRNGPPAADSNQGECPGAPSGAPGRSGLAILSGNDTRPRSPDLLCSRMLSSRSPSPCCVRAAHRRPHPSLRSIRSTPSDSRRSDTPSETSSRAPIAIGSSTSP